MATSAGSAAPPNSLRVWCDARWIYIELLGKPNSTILTFSRTGAGLSSALSLIFGHADNSSAMPVNYAKKERNAQSALAESILRRQGIIK
jgi:hypothetical protein